MNGETSASGRDLAMMIAYRPTMKQRRSALMRCGTYGISYAIHLWKPIRQVPAGMFEFGREPIDREPEA